MKYGFNGRILDINLSTGSTSCIELEEEFLRTYIGGSCFGAYFLLKEAKKGADPLGEENLLVFSTSIASGLPLPGFARYSVTFKSPLTGGVGASEAGGAWPVALKRNGFDGIIIRGKAPKPVYIWIKKEKAQIVDATRIWGLFPKEAAKVIKDEVSDVNAKMILIGPGSERLVRFGSAINGLRFVHGRGGSGAVMGSKMLKGVVVSSGGSMPVANPDEVRRIIAQFNEQAMSMAAFAIPSEEGSAGYVIFQNEDGQLPTENFRKGSIEGADRINATSFKPYFEKSEGCPGCPVKCKKCHGVSSAKYKIDAAYGSPEYESCATLGSYVGVTDTLAVLKANELCNKYTLDTISTGGTIAFAMECYEAGLLRNSDTEGLDLRFGNGDALVRLVEMIGERRGIGDLLAEGVKRAADEIGGGASQFALHVKGLEIPAHEPRVKPAVGLAYAVSPTGADHCTLEQDPSVEPASPEEVFSHLRKLGITRRLPLESLDNEKIRFFARTHVLFSVFDSLNVCLWCVAPSSYYGINDLEEIIHAVTGLDVSGIELLRAGERRLNLMRLFNLREGINKSQDLLPGRFFEPLRGGPREGVSLDLEKFQESIDKFYSIMGWDAQGVPTNGKLLDLGLEWAAALNAEE